LTPAERERFFESYFQRMTAPKPLARFENRREWMASRSALRVKIQSAIGLSPYPERVPLSPVITGKLPRAGYSIERVYYQVFPGVYASGYLYRPADQAGGAVAGKDPGARLPAVLNPHGHWALGAADPIVQSRCVALALKGYIAFCPDSTHVADLGVGLCPIGLMTWNNIRALDFLESLEDVDPSRLACTGESGGGQQTLYLAALDDRVKVLVPAVLVSYFRRILFSSEQTHCFCNHAPGILRVADEHEMAAMFAPRPTLFICATGDWTRDFPKEEFPEIRHIFDLVGGAVECVQFDKPHNYDRDSREQMYAWMNRFLKDQRDPGLAKEPMLVTEPPELLKEMGTPPPGAADLEGAKAWYRSRYLFRTPVLRSKSRVTAYQKRTRTALRDVLGEPSTLAIGETVSRGGVARNGLAGGKLLLATEPGVAAPAWWFPGAGERKRKPAVVMAHSAGRQELLTQREALLRDLVGAGVGVLAVDPRFRGELQRNWRWNHVIWGRPEEGAAAHDLNAAAAWLRGRPDVDPEKVFLAGWGEAGRLVLCAAALDEQWAGVSVESAGPLYADSDVLSVAPNILRIGDLPEIAVLAAPRPLWINGARGRFEATRAAYGGLKSAGLLCTDLSGVEFAAQFQAWLLSHAK
jgi:dienelactone hydrolase